MVHLVLSSTKGNQGLRYFPYTGYLGLTPVRVEGIVRSKLDSDQKALQAKSITISVRCYESRTGRVNTLHSNILVDYTKVLWSKSDDVEYDSIGNLEFPFRILIPAKVAGFSTAVFVDYRCMWRVEAVLTHVPISGVGSRQIRHFELPLVRYDLPPFSRISPSPEPLLTHETNKPRSPRIRYSVHPPRIPIGPLDLVSVPIHLRPLENGVSIRNASIVIERRIVLHDVPQNSTASSLTASNLQPSLSSSSLTRTSSTSLNPSSTSFARSLNSLQDSEHDSNSTSSTLSIPTTITPGTTYPSLMSITSETPLLSVPHAQLSLQSSPNSKVVANVIVGAESSGNFSPDENGTYSKTLTLQWPAAKSHSRWAIGESITSDLVSVKYFVRTKITISSPFGTDTVELAEQEIQIISTNEAERQLALAKYNELHDTMLGESSSRSKSKSPRRSRPERERGDAIPPSPGLSSITNAVASSSHSRSKASSRRPHTSAGPRDRPVNFAGGAYGRSREQEGEMSTPVVGSVGASSSASMNGATGKRRSEVVVMRSSSRPDSSHSSIKRSGGGLGFLSGNGAGRVSSSSFWSTVHSNGSAPRIKGAPSASSTSTTASSSSVSSSSHGAESDVSEHMREWEEELARIEVRSRRSSDMLGFSGKRKRPPTHPMVVLPTSQLDA
ncbi:hypothetical protein CPC08DRAFT_657891 [Agrocybe pediades]|nr:hypothetical protein CPC08DRAFT_657891 [Agrocybe pediades]